MLVDSVWIMVRLTLTFHGVWVMVRLTHAG